MALTQSDIDVEVADLQSAYEKARAGGAPLQHHPARDYAPYRSSLLRHPQQPLVAVNGGDPETVELSGPVFGATDITDIDSDLTRQHAGEPLGERITVSGRLLDSDGRPVRGQLVEIWQANASGRYAHLRDQHPAPLDPNFTGVGRTLTDDQGRYYLHHRQAGRVPVAQPHQRVAPRAHPLLPVRRRVHAAARDADVLPERPAVPLRPDPAVGDGRVGPAAVWSRRTTTTCRSPSSRWATSWDIVLDGPSATWIEEGR